jgi:uncharacterized delta-60 repeat protein
MLLRYHITLSLLGIVALSQVASAQAGELDDSFANIGITSFDAGSASDIGNAIAVQPDGKLVVVGQGFFNDTTNDAIVLRVNADGTLDNSFGTNGIAVISAGELSNAARDLVLLPDGKVVVVGLAATETNSFEHMIMRLNTNGTLDNTFGSGGVTISSLSSSTSEFLDGVALQADGKLIAVGAYYNGSSSDIAIVRYNANGTVDNTFGTNGMVSVDAFGATDRATDVVLAADGKIVASALVSENGTSKTAVVRFTATGEVDNTFGGDGLVVVDGYSYAEASYVDLQTDGKVLVGGTLGSSGEIAVVRLETNGAFDASFGTGGIVTTDLSSFDAGQGLAIQADGKILVAGQARLSGSDYDMVVLRYNTNGSLDNSFGTGGISSIAPNANGDDVWSGCALQPDGKLVLCGREAGQNTVTDIAVGRMFASSGVGFDEAKPIALGGLQVYPNPAADHITMEFAAEKATEALVKITTLDGRVLDLDLQPFTAVVGPNRMYISLPGYLARGIYLIQLTASGTTRSASFVK